MKRLILLLMVMLSLGWCAAEEASEDLAGFAARVAPGYTQVDGCVDGQTAMLLLTDAEGRLRFAGGLREGEEWVITLSTPLPEGVRFNTCHSYEGVAELILPEGYAGETCTIALQPDGRWLLCHVCDTSISEDMLWFGVLGPYYGDVQMERDITRLDWASLPNQYEDFLSLVDADGWAVVTGEGAPLYDPEGAVLATYLPGTPVQLLAGAEGERCRVAIDGGSVTGQMRTADLLIGADQLTVDESGYLAVVEDGFLWGENSLYAEDLPLYDAPGGAQTGTTGYLLETLASWPEGWLHVMDRSTGMTGFIRLEDILQPLLSVRYPDASILASACDEDDAFFVLEMGGDQPMKLCGFTLLDGSWVMTMDSNTAIRPNGLSDDYTRWNYNELTLTLREDLLSICYDGWDDWQYDFAKDDEGAWRFVRLYIADDVNAIYQEVIFSGGCVSQSLTDVYQDGEQETSFSPPCPMPWLANCETLSGFDAAAFPMTVYGMTQEEQGMAAEQLLPGYTFVGGKLSLGGATYLMTNPAGELVFVGGAYQDGQWAWTESNPLPADTRCDTYHGGGDWLAISYDHPDGEPDEYGNSPYVEYVIYLQEDGRWLVETILDYEEDFFHFEADGLYINLTGLVYGQSSLERDVRKINWAEYPISIAEVLPTMPDDWGVIGAPTLPLYADAEGATLLREYCVATPVHVLEYVGDLARVQIADSGVVGMTAPATADGIAKILPTSRLRRGVVVNTTDNGVHVDLYVVIEYGTNINTVSQNLIDRVTFVLSEYARVPLDGVEVHVQGIKVRK